MGTERTEDQNIVPGVYHAGCWYFEFNLLAGRTEDMQCLKGGIKEHRDSRYYGTKEARSSSSRNHHQL